MTDISEWCSMQRLDYIFLIYPTTKLTYSDTHEDIDLTLERYLLFLLPALDFSMTPALHSAFLFLHRAYSCCNRDVKLHAVSKHGHCRVERFFLTPEEKRTYIFGQLSDHYGVECELFLRPSDIIQKTELRRSKRFARLKKKASEFFELESSDLDHSSIEQSEDLGKSTERSINSSNGPTPRSLDSSKSIPNLSISSKPSSRELRRALGELLEEEEGAKRAVKRSRSSKLTTKRVRNEDSPEGSDEDRGPEIEINGLPSKGHNGSMNPSPKKKSPISSQKTESKLSSSDFPVVKPLSKSSGKRKKNSLNRTTSMENLSIKPNSESFEDGGFKKTSSLSLSPKNRQKSSERLDLLEETEKSEATMRGIERLLRKRSSKNLSASTVRFYLG